MIWNMMRTTLDISRLWGTLAVGLRSKIVDLDAEMVCQSVGYVVNIRKSGWSRRKGCSFVLEIGRRETALGNTPDCSVC